MYSPLSPSPSRGEVRRAGDASRETYLVGARDAPARTEDRGRGGDPDLQGRRPEGRDRRRRVPAPGPRAHHRVPAPPAHPPLRWSQAHGVRQIVALEGLPGNEAASVGDPAVWGVGSTDRARQAPAQRKTPP